METNNNSENILATNVNNITEVCGRIYGAHFPSSAQICIERLS